MKVVILSGVALAACTSPRTQIMARIDTDMTQGPTGTLTGVVVRVLAAADAQPRFEQRFDLDVGAEPLRLPATLGLVPADPAANSRVTVEVDALNGENLLFRRRAIVTFAQGHTLRADIFLADRCRLAENQNCPFGTTCGLTGCELEELPDLPELDEDAGPGPTIDAAVPLDGGGMDGGPDGGRDAGPRDSGAADSGPPDAARGDAACGADLTRDPLNCGTCGRACEAPPANGAAACVASACTIACDSGFWDVGGVCAPIGAPRPVGPSSMARVTRRQPTLRWRLPPGADGARVEICLDPACATVQASFDASGTSGAPPSALAASASDWRWWRLRSLTAGAPGTATSPVWAFDGTARMSTSTGPTTSWPLLFDVNLDGYGDVAVGAPGADEVHVFHGGAAGLSTSASRVLTGAGGSRLGQSVGTAGDVDGDGFADLIAGAPGAARAFVHRGSASGIAASGTLLAGPAGSDFGASVAAAGDVDGDGYGDVIVGAPSIDRAYLFRGGPLGVRASAPVELIGPAGSGFGTDVHTAGDVDGDLFNDVVVGAPGEAAAYVLRGSAAGLVVGAPIRLAGAAGSRFGTTVAGGDVVTADSFTEVIVGAPGAAQVLVFVGSAGGLETTPRFTLTGEAEFGISLAITDVDDSSFDDVIAGTSAGIVRVYYSNATGPGERPGWSASFMGLGAPAGWGRSLAPAHVARDAYMDVLVGAPAAQGAYLYAGQ
ncbi:MAG: FG-GAP repeat protein, partial [Sandaracinaceae bacterium]|nr:FG-GAP repeat protein [Sandaracinaceae bacterium]